jgi:hypothetical protein
MDDQYMIENIGRNALPHYERLGAMVALSNLPTSWNSKRREGEFPNWEDCFLKEEEYIAREYTGFMFWKKYYYTLTERGVLYLKAYCKKVSVVSKSLIHLYSNEENWHDLETLKDQVELTVLSEFRNMGDFVILRDVTNGHFMDKGSKVFRSLMSLSGHYIRQDKWMTLPCVQSFIKAYDDPYNDPFEVHLLSDYVDKKKVPEELIDIYFDAETPPETPTGTTINIQ